MVKWSAPRTNTSSAPGICSAIHRECRGRIISLLPVRRRTGQRISPSRRAVRRGQKAMRAVSCRFLLISLLASSDRASRSRSQYKGYWACTVRKNPGVTPQGSAFPLTAATAVIRSGKRLAASRAIFAPSLKPKRAASPFPSTSSTSITSPAMSSMVNMPSLFKHAPDRDAPCPRLSMRITRNFRLIISAILSKIWWSSPFPWSITRGVRSAGPSAPAGTLFSHTS